MARDVGGEAPCYVVVEPNRPRCRTTHDYIVAILAGGQGRDRTAIVGDRAQARHGFPESWQERLERIGLDRINLASLSINYRTPHRVGR